MAAVRFSAAVLFFACFAAPVMAFTLTVSGLPEWLEPAVIRSLSAVYSEIPDTPDIDREGTLAIVAGRLFAGYDVGVSAAPRGLSVSFSQQETTVWSAGLNAPDLRDMALDWFKDDSLGMEEELTALVGSLPGSALTWADEALRGAIGEVVKRRFPGWDFSVQAALGDGEAKLTVSIRPGPPLVLAISPSLYSGTIPAMFRSDLEARLSAELSPLIGLPVAWAERHKSGVEAVARAFLEDRHTVENMRAEVGVTFLPGPMSKLNARVDSDRFRFHVWVSAYAGLEGRYPEAGVYFGWNSKNVTRLPLEFYVEAIVELEDFETKLRLGGRFEFFRDIWAGAEVEWPGDLLFCRVRWEPRGARGPYVWWRWNGTAGHECAFGYRFDGHISAEIYYDGIESDKIGIRGLWSL